MGVFLPAREKEDTERTAIDKERTGQARPAALGDDPPRGIRYRLGDEIGFEVVQNAGLASLEHLLETTSPHQLRIALGNLHWSEVRPGPVSIQPCSVFGEEGAAEAIIGDDPGKAFEDPVEYILDQNSALARVRGFGQQAEFLLRAG